MRLLAGLMFGLVIGAAYGKAAYREDALVHLLEAQIGLQPKQTAVIPACSCTLRYDGTEVDGNHYAVHFDRLD